MHSNLQLSLLILILGAITMQAARPESQQKSGNHGLVKRGECFFSWIYDYHMLLEFVFTILLLCLVLSFCFDWEDISNTRDSVSSAIKHLEFLQKYSTVRSLFNSLLGVWISPWNTVSRVWYTTWQFNDCSDVILVLNKCFPLCRSLLAD